MTANFSKLKTNPMSWWLVRVKECRRVQRHESTAEVEDPENGMILGDNDGADQDEEDDLFADFRVNSIRSSKASKKRLTLSCPQREIMLETNAFVWPYPVWLTIRIEVHTNVISPPNHKIAECVQRGQFTPLEYFISDWLVSTDTTNQINTIDLTGGIGNISGAPLISQFLSCLRPEIKGNTEVDLHEVQSYDRFKQIFFDYLHSRRESDIRLNDITSLLSEYQNESNLDDTESALRQQVCMTLLQRIVATDEGNILQMASEAPDFFRLGPLLFPNKICNLMIRPSEDTSSMAESKMQLFRALDEIIVSEPWKLGFSCLIYEGTKSKCQGKTWSGIEAQLRHLKKATFYPDLTKQQKDALHVYDTIKVINGKGTMPDLPKLETTYLNYISI